MSTKRGHVNDEAIATLEVSTELGKVSSSTMRVRPLKKMTGSQLSWPAFLETSLQAGTMRKPLGKLRCRSPTRRVAHKALGVHKSSCRPGTEVVDARQS